MVIGNTHVAGRCDTQFGHHLPLSLSNYCLKKKLLRGNFMRAIVGVAVCMLWALFAGAAGAQQRAPAQGNELPERDFSMPARSR